MLILAIVCLLLSSCMLTNAQVKLGTYNIDKSNLTVSGISSGGAMATQLHVAFSSLFIGSGTIAGPPYYCAQGQLMYATSSCMTGLGLSVTPATLISKANSFATFGYIDATSNLKNDRVYIYSGSRDTTVKTVVVQMGEDFFKNYMSASQIKTVYSIASVHGHITDNYGSACGTSDTAYINNCDYNQVYDMFDFLYPQLNIIRPAVNYLSTGSMIQFDQKEFFPTGLFAPSVTMETYGWIYVPTQCATKQCKLHIALHGCLQHAKKIGDVYVRNAGYNQVADLNDFIILYPQATTSTSNSNGCWDWWGYVNSNYAYKTGPQMKAIRDMINRVASV